MAGESLPVYEKVMIKLIIAIILLLSSLLVLFRAPSSFLWVSAVAITSFPWFFMLVSVLFFFWGWRSSSFATATMLTSAAACIIFSLPVIVAYRQSAIVPAAINKIFPSAGTRGPVFRFSAMFAATKKVKFHTAVYKRTAEGKELMLDFYPAQHTAIAPLIIVIHGGSWKSGDSRQVAELNSVLAGGGYHVAAINYRLAPAYKSPAPVEDTRDAIGFLKKSAAGWKIDTNHIILLGRSAGGQIALTAAYSQAIPGVKGVIAYYAPADMVWGGPIRVNPWVLNTEELYNGYFGGVYSQVPEKFKEASACEYVTASSVPTLLIHGTTDPLVSQEHSRRLQRKLNNCGVKNFYLEIPFATHGLDYSIKSPAGQTGTYVIKQFISSVTNTLWKD